MVTDGRLNDAIIRHALDTKHKHILADPNPPQVTFKDMEKFDAQNPIIDKLLNQIGACNLSDKKIKEQLGQLKDRELETFSSNLDANSNFSNNSNNNNFGWRSTGLPSPQELYLPLPSPGAPDEPFDPFAGVTAPIPSLSRVEPSLPPYLNDLFCQIIILCLQNELSLQIQIYAELLANQLSGVILRVIEAESPAPELSPENEIRVSPILRRTFPELSDEEEDNEPSRPEFTIPNFDEIRHIFFNDGEIPPELECFNGGQNPRFEQQIINGLGINQDSRDF